MKILKQIFLLVISFVLTIIVCELFIRNAKIAELSFAEFYDDIGKGLPKTQDFVFFNEGLGIVSTNQNRFIGQNVSVEKNENTIRIALLGDSYIESVQIFKRHYFGNIAEDIIQKQFPEKNIEVINFGRSSFNLGRMYAYQKLLVDKFNPDFVLYFLSGDDLINDYSYPPLLPKSTIVYDSLVTSLDMDLHDLNNYQSSKFLTQNVVLFNILNSCRYRINNGETFNIIFDKFYSTFKPVANSDRINSENKIEVDQITQKIISDLDSNTIIINRDKQELPQSFINLCDSNGLNYWNLISCLDSLHKSGTNPFEWKTTNKMGHWNQYAHRVIGNEIGIKLSKVIKNRLSLQNSAKQTIEIKK